MYVLRRGLAPRPAQRARALAACDLRVNVTCRQMDSCSSSRSSTQLSQAHWFGGNSSVYAITMASSSSPVNMSGNVQALSNAIAVAILSQQTTTASSPSAVATGGPATTVQSGTDSPSSSNSASYQQGQSQRYRY